MTTNSSACAVLLVYYVPLNFNGDNNPDFYQMLNKIKAKTNDCINIDRVTYDSMRHLHNYYAEIYNNYDFTRSYFYNINDPEVAFDLKQNIEHQIDSLNINMMLNSRIM